MAVEYLILLCGIAMLNTFVLGIVLLFVLRFIDKLQSLVADMVGRVTNLETTTARDSKRLDSSLQDLGEMRQQLFTVSLRK